MTTPSATLPPMVPTISGIGDGGRPATLRRYLLRQTLKPGLIALGVMLGLVWMLQSMRFIDFIINKGLGLATFLQLTLLLVPTLLMIILPLAVFAGMVAAGRRWLDDSELAVMMATGSSRLAILRAPLALALAACALGYLNSLWVLPVSMQAFKTLQYELRTMDGELLLEEATFNPISDNMMVYLTHRDSATEMSGLLVQDTHDPSATITWIAKTGHLIPGPDGSPRAILHHGVRQEVSHSEAGDRVNALSFEEQTLDLKPPTADNGANRDREKEEYFLPELMAAAHTPGLSHKQRNRLLTEANRRLLWPLTPLPLVALAGAWLLQRPQRRQPSLRRVAPAIGCALGYQSLLMAGNAFGENGGVSALYALWLIPALTLAVAGYYLYEPVKRGG